jgi:hypothetical protein
MKALNAMSRDFAKEIKRAKKKLSITARLCALLSGGKRSSSSRSAEQPLDEEVLHDTTIYIITINISCYQEDMMMRDDACATSPPSCSRASATASASASASDAFPVAANSIVVGSSPRQAMELCDDAGDVMDLSQLSQLSCADKADDVKSTTLTGMLCYYYY